MNQYTSLLLLVFTLLTHGLAEESNSLDVIPYLQSRGDCQTNPNWQLTRSAWNSDNADESLSIWWQNGTTRPGQTFANALGKEFGSHLNGFQCGIGAYSTCIAPACAEYQDNNNPPWAYLATLAVVNLNQFFNAMYIGISNGQADYHALTNDMANRFFPWKDPNFLFDDAAFWIVALLTALLAIPAGLGLVEPIVALGIVGFGAFAGAGVQEISKSLEPDAISSQLTRSEGLAKLDVFAEQVGSASRESLEKWANATMNGEADDLGMSILDYLRGGSFAGGALPSFTQIEQYYKKQMVSRTINSQWRKEKVFIMFHQTNDTNDASGPNQTRYYSPEDQGVYYMYRYSEDKPYRGHLAAPWGLEDLNDTPTYDITGNDITKASAGAFRVAGFNYTQNITSERLIESMSSNGTLTPFADGAAWEGTWTIPVCNTSTHNFNTQYAKMGKYGRLPCCCGEGCRDTAAFVEAANMMNFVTLLMGCRSQLKDTDLRFGDIDYGFTNPLAGGTGRTRGVPGVDVGLGVAVGLGLLFALGGLGMW